MTSYEAPQTIIAGSDKAAKTTPVHVVTTEISLPSVLAQETLAPASQPKAIATKVLKIIEQYGLNYERTGSWDGFETFFPTVLGQVSRGEPVRMLLPGFPFKSPNSRDKVLSSLPDLGEELALKHLNGLCENIKTVYEHGAEVHITSDGLVYNGRTPSMTFINGFLLTLTDLLSVPDQDVWNFGEAVRQITVEHGLRHLSFLRLWDLLGTPGTWSKEHYLANACNIRQELMERYGDPQFEADMANKSSSDMQMTHTKYLEFLKSDLLLNENWLVQSPEEQAVTISNTAKAMMARWKAFAAALEANRTDYVRLSIHDSGGKDKLSMALIPQKQRGALGATPWHSVVVAELDGSYRSVQRHTVDHDKYELVHHKGRPYFFRAKSELFDWSTDGCEVNFEHLYPTGLIIRPTSGAPSLTIIPMKTVRTLANTFSPVVLRGFSGTTERDAFANSTSGLEEVFTSRNGVEDRGEATKVVIGDTKQQLNSPTYQIFSCTKPVPMENSHALFTASRLFFRYLPPPWSVQRLEAATSDTQSELSLVIRHPATGEPCIRWQEVLNKTRSTENENQSLFSMINAYMYDWRVCLRFSWEKDDVLVTDNAATLHHTSRLMMGSYGG